MPTRRTFLATPALAATRLTPGSVPLRTHEWFGDRVENFQFPAGWEIQVHHMHGVNNPVLRPAQIRDAILHPVGTPPLRELAAGKRTVAIAFDDLTRPTPTYEIVPHVVAELRAAGIADDDILFCGAYGAHYQMNGMEVAKKLGEEAVRRHPWINHNIWENLDDLGTTRHRNRILVNSYYNRADLKLTISGLKAHGLPGYGGGPKAIIPGIAGMETIRYNHEVLRQKPRPRRTDDGKSVFYVWNNEQREDMIDAARAVKVHFSVQVVYNHERRPVHVVAGDIVRAHHRAARFSVNHLSTDFATNADIVVVNAYPKGAQLHEHFGWGERGLKDGGSIVVINQNPMGEFVWHYLDEAKFNRQPASYFAHRSARKRRYPNASQVLLYSQYLQRRELDHPYFPPEAQGLRDWNEVIARLQRQHQGDVKVAVYPYAGIQHGKAVLDIPDEQA